MSVAVTGGGREITPRCCLVIRILWGDDIQCEVCFDFARLSVCLMTDNFVSVPLESSWELTRIVSGGATVSARGLHLMLHRIAVETSI